jgi:DNA-binding LacI/PurR family transcriptional regulator
MSVTLKDLAQRVGKSVTTVSRALHDYDDVSPETKALVRRAATEMGYQPDATAQRLQKRRTDTLGLIIPTLGTRTTDQFFNEFLAGISHTAHELNYDILVSSQPQGEPELNAYRTMISGKRVDGFLLARTQRSDERIHFLIERGIPFVAFGRIEGEVQFPLIDVDGYYGMNLVAEHLVENGHQRIAFIAPDPTYNFTAYRLSGFLETLSKVGIRVEDSLIMSGDLSQRNGYACANQLLDLPAPPTAIATGNDLMALGAIKAAQERGLVVGQDIAITGFDDIAMAEDSNPPLTTVHQPVFKIGEMVCEMLVKIIRGESLEHEQVILKPNLVVRKSSGFELEQTGNKNKIAIQGGDY